MKLRILLAPAAESGYPGFDASLWLAIMAPAGTPADLAALIRDGLPKYAQIIKAAGMQPQ